jgi:hypothetical protein
VIKAVSEVRDPVPDETGDGDNDALDTDADT